MFFSKKCPKYDRVSEKQEKKFGKLFRKPGGGGGGKTKKLTNVHFFAFFLMKASLRLLCILERTLPDKIHMKIFCGISFLGIGFYLHQLYVCCQASKEENQQNKLDYLFYVV